MRTKEQIDLMITWQMAKAEVLNSLCEHMKTAPPQNKELLKTMYKAVKGDN